MSKMYDKEPTWSKLWEVEIKMKAVAYLFENQTSQPSTHLQCEMNDIHLGLSKIILNFTDDISQIRSELEEIDFNNSFK